MDFFFNEFDSLKNEVSKTSNFEDRYTLAKKIHDLLESRNCNKIELPEKPTEESLNQYFEKVYCLVEEIKKEYKAQHSDQVNDAARETLLARNKYSKDNPYPHFK